MTETTHEITAMLRGMHEGDDQAKNDLFALLHNRLRSAAAGMLRREKPDNTLEPTALFNEAIIKLMGTNVLNAAEDRRLLISAMIRAMRQVLVDYARKRNAAKRPSRDQREPMEMIIDHCESTSGCRFEELSEALDELALASPDAARAIECRYFAGMKIAEIAEIMDASQATVKRKLLFAKALLAERIGETPV